MRKILKIALRELSTLFYSPVAWLLLVIFAIQASMLFTGILDIMIQQQFSRPLWYSIASGIFTGSTGILLPLQGYLYLYIPLLTMGLISRERGSGTIKLLYSSPVTTFQVVAGKFLSMMLYGLALISVLLLFLLFLSWRVPHLDAGIALSGIAGTYLLILTYAAIGLYLSSLTSYQIVAAVGTLAVLALLNRVGTMGQHVDFLRDITYWLSLRGRAEEMVGGLVRGEDIYYFILVIALFCTLAALKIASGKRRDPSATRLVARHMAVIGLFLVAGYITSIPRLLFFIDATATGSSTLAPASQEIIQALPDELTITTYVNLLDENFQEGMPENRNHDKRRFNRYTRFKPATRLRYVYYYADPILPGEPPPTGNARERAQKRAGNLELAIERFLSPEEISREIDLSTEGYRFTRVIESQGKSAFLRLYADGEKHPREQQISTAFKRLVTPPARAYFLSGHGERDSRKLGDGDYYTFVNSRSFRYSLVNSGFDVIDILPGESLPEPGGILVIASPRLPLPADELQAIARYLDNGGDMLLVADPDTRNHVSPIVSNLGVTLLPGTLVSPSGVFDDNVVPCRPTAGAARLNSTFRAIADQQQEIVMQGALAIIHDTLDNKGYRATPLLQTRDTGCWNDLDACPPPGRGAILDSLAGEREGIYTTAIALARSIDDNREQRIIIAGDADCISNAGLQAQRPGIRSVNFSLITAAFRWLTRDEFPLIISRPQPSDTLLQLTREEMPCVKTLFSIIIPAIIAIAGACCLFRRKKR
ncbi:MAG: Gldg family protein [Odoribacteraceae bacterium]|jgi:ABC-2 type transport system permease protein|nr:Gldg family protein [Odoribacteraceae bacterium]